LLDGVRANRTPYIDSYLHGIDLLVHQKRYDEARRNMVQETLPRLFAYHNAWNDFVSFQGEQMEEAAHRQVAEEALRDAETHYRLLVEQLPAVPYVAEPGGGGRVALREPTN